MCAQEVLTRELTAQERRFVVLALNEFFGTGSEVPFPIGIVGAATTEEFGHLVGRLQAAIEAEEPLSDLDWARALLLTEVSWASDIIGAGTDSWTNFPDDSGVQLLRALQYKFHTSTARRLLFPDNGGRNTLADFEAQQPQVVHADEQTSASGLGDLPVMRTTIGVLKSQITTQERQFMFHALNEYFGLAGFAPFPIGIVGAASSSDFDFVVARLKASIKAEVPLSDLDWARALLLTEVSWASDIMGAGTDSWSNFPDDVGVQLLRSLQYRFDIAKARRLLFPDESVA